MSICTGSRRASAARPDSFAMRLGLVLMTGVVMAAACAADPPKPDANSKGKQPPLTATIEARPAASDVTSGQAAELKPPIDEAHPLYLPLQEAYKAREALQEVTAYEAVFTKRELIGRKLIKTTMNLKLRQEQPFSVYLKFVEPHAGREVIYVEGRNSNKLLAHETGFKSLVGTLSLLPTSADAMADNRYPVTSIGLKTLLDKIIKQWEEEGKFGEIKTQKYPNAKLPSGEECVAYEALHPTPRTQFKFHVTRLWIDKQSGLAIRVEQLGFPQKNDKEPPVIEEYTYSNLKTDVKLTDRDFDPKNPSYAFP